MNKPEKNWLEWTIFAVSLAIILATAGLLVKEEWSLGKNPADPQLELGRPEVHGNYFALPVKVINRGDETAQDVHLEITLHLPGGEAEKGEFALDYLPRRSSREAWVTFLHDPSKGKLEPRVLGYQKP